MSGQPLVSVIVTTRNRANLLPQTIRCFQKQTYADKELIVVDGSDEPVEALCAGLPGVRYLRAAPESTRGACLNLAIENASGEILQRFDDDDYYHPGFLERSAATIVQSDDQSVVAWCCFNILIAGEAQIRYSGHGWGAGSTHCFHRSTWQRTPFRDERVAEDFFFPQDSGAKIVSVCAPQLFMLVRHGGNDWRRMGATSVDDYFRSIPTTGLRIDDVVDASAIDFYRSLRPG